MQTSQNPVHLFMRVTEHRQDHTRLQTLQKKQTSGLGISFLELLLLFNVANSTKILETKKNETKNYNYSSYIPRKED